MRNDSPELEHKKRCACRRLWHVRSKPTPSAEENNRLHPTWEEWFMHKFGEPMYAVHARIHQDNREAHRVARLQASMTFQQKMGR